MFESLVTLIFTPVTNLLLCGKWFEEKAIVPVTSRASQTYSAITGVMVCGP